MIEIRQLSKRFGSVTAVDNVSVTIPDGAITALLGPNGAGKTTTLRMIAGLITPDHGEAMVDGIAVARDTQKARERLSMLSDARGLYQRLTARENITYYGRLHGLTDQAIAERIARFADPLDMQGILDRRTEGFSTGEKMKVAIVRALVHDPQNIILDEPTNGLDVATVRAMRNLIKSLADERKCVLLTSHIMQEVTMLAGRIIIIAEGRIAADGTPDDILAAAGESRLEDAFVKLSGMSEENAA